MTDYRTPLPKGTVLRLGSTDYTVEGTLGCGANAIVYKAGYPDSLLRDKIHIVLIKELFPYHKDGLIYRENGRITTDEKAEAFFDLHRQSFLRGNAAHMDLQQLRADKTTHNINSFAANGTLYTLIGDSNGQTLREALDAGQFRRLRDMAECLLNILDALRIFHDNGMLHLDISPDNILLLPSEPGNAERLRQVLLIDYNSTWAMEALTDHSGLYYSIKEAYTAPEVRLKDYASVRPATDLFSVCAIFLEMLQGKPLTLSELTDKRFFTRPLQAAVLENCPAAVAQKVNTVVKRGLRLPPKQRYQHRDALAADLRELIDRINGVGVTHSALWEASAANYRHYVRDNPIFDYLRDNTLITQMPEIQPAFQIITGGGGMGKTTLLLTLWENGLRQYDPQAAVPVYIPLYHYKSDSGSFIKQRLLERLKFDPAVTTVNDALHALDQLLDTPLQTRRGECPAVWLLLDGLNEMPDPDRQMKALRMEIEALRRKKGVAVLLTTRDAGAFSSSPQETISLPPLTPERIHTFLNAHGILYPNSEPLQMLLTVPLMLSLYVKVCQNKNAPAVVETPQALMDAYLDSLIEAYVEKQYGGAAENACASCAIRVLLPYIARRMQQKNTYALSPQAVYAAVQRCFNDIQTKNFMMAFPAYIGKIKALSGGAANAGEWFDHTIWALLKDQFSLLRQDEQGQYCLAHADFRDHLSAAYGVYQRTLWGVRVRRALPKAALCGILLAAVTVGAWAIGNRFVAPFPYTAEEKNIVGTAVSRLTYVVGLADMQFYTEQKLVQDITSAVTSDPQAYREWQENKQRLLQTIDAQSLNETENALIIEYLTHPRNTIPLDVLKNLLAYPAENRTHMYARLAALSAYIAPDSLFPETDKQAVTALYAQWIENRAMMLIIAVQQVLAPLGETERHTVLYKTPYVSVLNTLRVHIPWEGADFADRLEACRTADFDLSLQLKMRGFTIAENDETKKIDLAPETDADKSGKASAGADATDAEAVLLQMLTDIGNALSWYDTCMAYYESALNAAERYLASPSDDVLLATAQAVCETQIQNIEALSLVAHTQDRQTASALIAAGFDMADFYMLFDAQTYYRYEYTDNIHMLLYYLNHAPTLNLELSQWLTMQQRVQAVYRKINYLGVNHFLAERSEAAVADFAARVASTFPLLTADRLPWDNEKSVIAAKVDAVFMDADQALEIYAGQLAEEYAAVLRDKQAYRTWLIENGFSETEADERLASMQARLDEE